MGPGPTKYSLQSDFNKNLKKANIFSFVINREAYAKVYVEGNQVQDPSFPGPGNYENVKCFSKNPPKYSMRAKSSFNSLFIKIF